MTDKELIEALKNEYTLSLLKYNKRKNYYEGKHDITSKYEDTENIVVANYIENFINSEVSYVLGNKITYTSRAGNTDIINALKKNTYHWNQTHDQELLRQAQIYGESYELYYINADNQFSAKILNPTNAIVYTDSDNIPIRFIHFYKKKFDNSDYFDVYYPDKIEIYKNNCLVEAKPNILKRVPVSICKIDDEQVLFNKIKKSNDAYNRLLSDQQSIISSYKNAYLVVSGADVDETTQQQLKKSGIINLKNSDAKVDWLLKNINDTFIKNQVECIKTEIFELAGHVPTTEKLQSNLSGVALRSRLIALEQRCTLLEDCVTNAIITRIKYLFEYLKFLTNVDYDYTDIAIKYTANIPQDLVVTAQIISQLGDKLSLSTALGLLPFVDNPALEIEKIRKEQEDEQSINLDKVGLTNE